MSTTLEWCDIVRVLETKKLILFYRSSDKAYVFPKSQINEQTVLIIRKIVSEKIMKNKRKLLRE